MADIDHFKQVNDVHGHDAGDHVLMGVGEVIRRSLRGGDVPCRYGGEEFLILVTDIGVEGLLSRAENLRERVARHRSDHRGRQAPSVTMSFGVALYPQHGDSPSAVIKAADAALYAAKRAGRNRVALAEPSTL